MTIGGLVFSVMLTRGGAVRWFKVTRARRRRRSGPTALERRRRWPRVRGAHARRRPRAGLLAVSAPCRRSPSSDRALVAADAVARGARLARQRGAAAARGRCSAGPSAPAGWRRHLVAVRQHAPLRRAAGLAGRARRAGAARRSCRSTSPRRWRRSPRCAAARVWRAACCSPPLWLLAELARGVLFTGFPWVAERLRAGRFAAGGFAPWLGVYGIGAVVALASRPALRLHAAAASRALAGCRAALAGRLLALGARRRPIDFTEPTRAPRVTLLQGNVPQDEKFAAAAAAGGAGLDSRRAPGGARRPGRRARNRDPAAARRTRPGRLLQALPRISARRARRR